ncbi:hypothetical protein AVEN_112028-1 [Araneus ventricosus]|uniref:EGF-like domain-containing protein n=1 Tax=Araneus ventricosus TaxID=182803 RepID=A0A4Y2QQK1_ARAVE|nr:hypothetical protein AVEN_112028-1 [Araneus ventricosus]
MWTTYLVLTLIALWIVSFNFEIPSSQRRFEVREGVYRKNCETDTVHCIDDCSFLCIQSNAQCIGGECIVLDDTIRCRHEYGGLVVLTTDGKETRHWKCLCTDSSFYGGDDCGTLVSDVCENGIFLYKKRDHHLCICDFPFVKMVRNGKPYCLKPEWAAFFDTKEFVKKGASLF